MQRYRSLPHLSAGLLLLFATVCRDTTAPSTDAALAPSDPLYEITDARDESGIAHFFFLEPVDRRPRGERLGPPDLTLERYLAVEICLWTATGCAQPLLARYTSTSGVGRERLHLDDDDPFYKVRWYTSRFESVRPGQVYRVTVLAAGVPLGSADVRILRKSRGGGRGNRDDYVDLRDDDGMTIRFYIEKCGVFVLPAAGGSATPCVSGSIIATADEGVGVIIPPNALAAATRLSLQRSATSPADPSVAAGPYIFEAGNATFAQPVTLAMAYDPARLPSGFAAATLTPYLMSDKVWQVVQGGSVDVVRNRVTFAVSHFSQYAVLAPVASITLTVPSTPLAVGGTAVATATTKDASGRVLQDRKLEWSVSPAGIVDVDATGKVTAKAAGEATLTVVSEGQSASSKVTVGGAKAAAVVISGASSAPLDVGATLQLTAKVLDANNLELPGRTVAWSSSSDAAATVDKNGLVKAVGAGEATITATADAVSATIKVTVRAKVGSVVVDPATSALVVDATQQLSAKVLDASKTELTGRSVAWSSSDVAIAAVDQTGLVTAKKPGDAVITATSEGVSGTAAVNVRAKVSAVTVSPATASLVTDSTLQLTARVTDPSGAILPRTIVWSSSNPAAAAVDQTGLVKAMRPGDATITATAEGMSGTAAVNVRARVNAVTVAPATSALVVGGTQQLLATVLDAGKEVLIGRAVAWSSSSDLIAIVDQTGLVKATGAGDVTITAMVEGVKGTAAVSVRAEVSAVTVSPASATLDIKATQQLSAKVTGATGGELLGLAVAWSSSSDLIASVDQSGLVTATGPGEATITATVEGVSGTSKVTVRARVSAVVVSPLTATLEPNGTQQLSVRMTDPGGTELSGRTVVWSSSDATIASVNQSGLVTAVKPGDATITALVEGVSGASMITVRAKVHAVTVSPTGTELAIGGKQQLAATVTDANGAVLSRAVVWSSSNGATATVDQNGLVTATGPGDATITATAEAVSGSATVKVRAPVTSVVVNSGASGPLDVGATRQLTATVSTMGGIVTGRALLWTSSDPGVATVDALTGLVTALSAGKATISATVEGVSGTNEVMTRALPFGPYHVDQSLFAAPFTGALRELKPDATGISMLDAARRAGFRLIIRPVRSSNRFQDPVTGRFRLDLWKLELDRFRGLDYSSYIRDGTIIGIYLVDEPMDPSNWLNKEGCIKDPVTLLCKIGLDGLPVPDPGEPVSFADIEAMAAYGKQFFPDLPMGVGSRPSQVEPGAPFANLEFALAQYTTKKGTIQTFISSEIAAAKRARLGVQLSINVLAGNGSAPVLASQLRQWGLLMASEPYACALTMWKWDAVDSPGSPANSYWKDPAILAALQDVASAVGKHPPVVCRPH